MLKCRRGHVYAASEPLLQFVNRCAGPSLRSYVTSYIYYDKLGQRSKPHVDNAFIGITVMVGLRQQNKQDANKILSSSIIFWPESSRLEYRLKPGEISVFFGACVLHGRTYIAPGESVQSLLMSFRPDLSFYEQRPIKF